MQGFIMTAAIAEEFFNRCLEREAVTLEERISIMKELVEEKQAKELDEEGLKEVIQGKKILIVKKKPR